MLTAEGSSTLKGSVETEALSKMKAFVTDRDIPMIDMHNAMETQVYSEWIHRLMNSTKPSEMIVFLWL
jgi:hypothetical protein